ncbi:MAG: hypothetical protein CVV47_12070 [Spirochaetae bacterium HGW-Spirochaetae-3]|nr:MAG: hypothetical protein CVV47_12070 [Spirochaetae bacterium HGW-Spirochaetae-3]
MAVPTSPIQRCILRKPLSLLFPLLFIVFASASAGEKTVGQLEYRIEAADSADPAFVLVSGDVPNGKVQNVDEASFKLGVLDSDYPVFVFFWAEWDGPSRKMLSVVDILARQYKGQMRFVRVNADGAPDVCAEYGIEQLPTFAVFKDGKMVGQQSGAVPEKALKSFIVKQLK